MKIIQEAPPIKCNCGVIFEYDKKDVRVDWRDCETYVVCPLCNRIHIL